MVVSETGLFWVQSRYYDPEVGRWINADDVAYVDPETINGLNLYSYCGSNPINRVDPSGHAWWDIFKWIAVGVVALAAVAAIVVGTVVTGGALGIVLAGVGVGAIVGGGIGGVSALASGKDFAAGFLGGALTGAAIGAMGAMGGLVGTGVLAGGAAWSAFGIGVGASFVAGMGSYTIETLGNGEKFNVGKMFLQGVFTAIEGATSFGMGAAFAGAGAWSKMNKLAGSKVAFAGGGKALNFALTGIRLYFTNVFAKGPTFPFRYAFL